MPARDILRRASRLSMTACAVLSFALFTSCGSSRDTSSGKSYFRELARAGIRLGFDIEEHDDHALMLESARWLGAPYRYGGNTRRGVDCSGLSCAIYNKVYSVRLERTCASQLAKDCRRVAKGSLRSGDLVFFTTSSSGREAGHVGVYLKDGRFIHASTSKGVIVSGLDENYFKKHWLAGGRVKDR